MWARNLLFIALCFAGFLAVAANLWEEVRMAEPTTFCPEEYEESNFRHIVEQINAQFRADWDAVALQPADRAEDLTLIRRASLALTGTIPSLEEIRAFESRSEELSEDQNVQWWLSHLLEDRRSADYLAERLARVYVGTENGPFLIYRRRRFITWLSDRLHENQPYDHLVRTLIADTGLWTSSPAVNFVTVTFDQDGTERPDEKKLARRVSRAFLGVRLDCVQCHDDMMGGSWTQQDFHRLAAYFSESSVQFTGIRDKQRDYVFQYLDESEEEVVTPEPPFFKQLVVDQGNRREQLADWVTHQDNLAFARAAVNRFWALMLGKPLVEPIDSIPLEATAENPYPPGLEILADDFVRHGYDLRRLVRLIAATEAFQRASTAEHEITRDHEQHWAAFPLTRLRPDQVSGSVLQAASIKTIDAESHIVIQFTRANQQKEFVKRYGDTGEDEFTEDGGTIPQRLLMMNGNLVKKRTEDNLIANAATQIAALAPDDDLAIETAYLATLTRRPTEAELAYFGERLHKTKRKKRGRVVEDLYWTLINSTEFSWNH